MVKLLLFRFRVANSMVKLIFSLTSYELEVKNIKLHLKLLTEKLKKQNVDVES